MRSSSSSPGRPPTAIVAASVLALVGCSDGRPPLYPAQGVVTFANGDPVRHASIEFVPSTPGPSPRSRIDAAGRFELGTYAPRDGAPAGDYRVVVVQSVSPMAGEIVERLGTEHAEHAGATKVTHPKHASPDTTGVTSRVEPAPTNELRIVVDPMGERPA